LCVPMEKEASKWHLFVCCTRLFQDILKRMRTVSQVSCVLHMDLLDWSSLELAKIRTQNIAQKTWVWANPIYLGPHSLHCLPLLIY
jgi:hypothetical protein